MDTKEATVNGCWSYPDSLGDMSQPSGIYFDEDTRSQKAACEVVIVREAPEEAYKKGREAYHDTPWADTIPNPYQEGTANFEEFEKGWDDADFSDKVESGYFDWQV